MNPLQKLKLTNYYLKNCILNGVLVYPFLFRIHILDSSKVDKHKGFDVAIRVASFTKVDVLLLQEIKT